VKLQIDPSISWGDIVLGTGLVVSGILAFTDVSAKTTLNSVSIEHLESNVNQLESTHREHLAQERLERQLMREEVREDLSVISAKLDRMLERAGTP
jgi:hypothetical protein